MLKFRLMFLVSAVPVLVAICPVARAGITTQTVSFHSRALDAETTYIVALPSPLEPGRRYPVVYILHGAYGNFRDWTDKTTVTQALDGRNLVAVFPDGGEFGWYMDSLIKVENQYESAISRDVREDVERRFAVRTDRGGRGIAGLSMGGHGALSLAAKHPDFYVSASAMSGILDITTHSGKWGLDDVVGKQSEYLDHWRANSVVYLADRFTSGNVALLFDTGVEDETGAVENARAFHEELERLGIPHVYREYPGTHNWDYWGRRISEHLDFHEKQFTGE